MTKGDNVAGRSFQHEFCFQNTLLDLELLSMMIDLRRKRITVQCLVAAHDSNMTYPQAQSDLLVTRCFKVSQTLHARCVFNQFLLESITWTKKCKTIPSLKWVDLASAKHPYDWQVHQHTHAFSLEILSRFSSSKPVKSVLAYCY